ncbi:MAG: hypothetical protein Q8R92_11725, partial [Deltaproteobacteria bacterium]|nr:hypothetical protein [Deltaproteobacteria bacterium]
VTVVETSFDAETWIENKEPIRVRFDRMPDPAEGRIAIFIGETDLSSQFKWRGNELVFDPAVISLPSGEKELIVQFVKGDDWKEIARFPIRVLTHAGFERLDVDPRFDANVWSRIIAEPTGDIARPEKTPKTAADFGVGVDTDFERSGAQLQTSFNFLGVTEKNEALQYGNKGSGADQFDLSDYLVTLRKGDGELQIGHIVYGDQRHILNQFYSRGLMASYTFKDKVFLSVASMNATSIVGYDNFSGLEHLDHHITAGSIGLQLFDRERISSRFDTTLLIGKEEPETDFNVGEIADKKVSQGIGFRLRTDAFSERIRTDIGFARSSFENPFDNDLSSGEVIGKSKRSTDNAYYGEASVELLRQREFWKGRSASLTTTYRHEMVDPLYQSLGAYTQADLQLNEAVMDLELAGVSGQFMHTWMEDNVDDIPTLLKTKTRDARFNVNVPVGQLWDGRGSGGWWWPNVSYSWNRVHQFGANMPRMAGYGPGSFGTLDPSVGLPAIVVSADDIPNLVSTLQNVLVSFTHERWSAEYSYSHSDEDTRNGSASNADFVTGTHSISGTVRPVDDVSVTAGYERTRVKDEMASVNSYTRSYNLGFEYEFFPEWTLLGNYTTTRNSDGSGGAKSGDVNLETELARRFELPGLRGRKHPGRIYVRHFWQSTSARDPLLLVTEALSPDPSQSGHLWILSAGMSISFF